MFLSIYTFLPGKKVYVKEKSMILSIYTFLLDNLKSPDEDKTL